MPVQKKIHAPKTAPRNTEEFSTREMILRRALELINARGMVEFRIDTLATSLGLSPGNITYHFSRKEDICVALWEQYLDEYDKIVRSLTTLLDLKQFYLQNRAGINLTYRYRGVVTFRNSDIGALGRDAEAGRVNEEKHSAIVRRAVELLDRNGYLDRQAAEEVRNGSRTFHYIVSRWGINFAYQTYPPEEVESRLDYVALLSLHALYPLLNRKGQEEFAEILAIVSSGDLLGDKSA